MALFKIFNNIGNKDSKISDLTMHQTGYCYFDANTNKFYIDTNDEASGLRQLSGTFFGECTTSASTSIKTADIDGFDLVKGVSVFIKFTITNSAAVANLKLNISNTGDIPIKRYGTTNLPSANNLTAGMVCQFVYDGTNWLWVGHIDTNSDTNVRQGLSSNTDNINRPLLLSYANNSNTTANIDNIVYRANNIYANPVTGNLTANNFIGTINGHSVNIDVPADAKFTDTTYTIGDGLNLNSDNVLSNSGVRSISAGDTKGTLNVNIGGQTREIVVPGFYNTNGQDISDTYSTKAETVTNINWDSSNKKLTQTIDNTTTDIVSIGTIKTALNLSKNDIGLDKVENTKLSTWIGTNKITTVGTLSSGSIPWTLLTDIPSSFTPSTHQHGNINNNGTISSNGVEIENNDSFIFIDSSNSNKIEHSSEKFDGMTTNKALTQKGTFETFVIPSTLDAYAKKASPSFTGAPTAPTAAANTNNNQIATTAFVMDALSRINIDGDFIFKGLISKVADLPISNYEIGWVYKIETPGIYFGQYCETGDTIYCKSINGNDDDWVILQSNIDGAVIGPVSSTAGNIATFTGTTGRAIQDSGKTIITSINSNSDNTSIPTSKAVVDAFANAKVQGANLTTTAGSITYYNDTNGTFASDENLTWDSTNQTLTANKLKGYVVAGQKAGTTLGQYATAEGYQTISSGNQSHAEGQNTIASGPQSHAEGRDTTASGNYSHTEGNSTTASGPQSHAEGRDTTASGGNSHAEGRNTTASGDYSHTEGYRTTASGNYSHAEGYKTTANYGSQHVFGEYNIADSSTANATDRGNYVEIVGNGTSDNVRSNARTLDWDGNEVLAGKLSVGVAPTEDMDVATKQYVDNIFATQDISGKLDKSIGTTKGDIIYWSAASTPTRLAIGTTGHFLKATANGPAYSALTKDEVTTALGYTPSTTNTTYSAGTGLSLSGTTFNISTVPVANGGTGNTSFTTNRLMYSESATKLSSATSLYATDDSLAINKTSITSGYKFEVGGKTKTIGINNLLTGTGIAAVTTSPKRPAIWTFNSGVTAQNGDKFLIKVPVAGHENGVFISVDNGANYYPASVQGTSRLTTHFPVDSYVEIIFNSSGQTNDVYPRSGGTVTTNVNGGAWEINSFRDTDTDTKVRQTLYSENYDLPLLMAYSQKTTTTADVDNVIYRNNNIYANPSTGFITSNLLMKKLRGTQDVTYGDSFPESPQVGDFFFLAGEDTDNSSGSSGESFNSQKVMVEPSMAKSYVLGSTDQAGGSITPTLNPSVYTQGSVLYGAAWNDYAEYRETNKVIPGNCVIENGDGSLSLSTQRLQPGAAIVTDTFGFIIGETEKAKTPIAISGRVLAYTYEDRQSFIIGQPVCSGPNGTISMMTDEEAREYPWLILGTVSEIPSYLIWNNKINVNNRIWIKVW